MSKVFSAHAVSVDGYISGRTPDGEQEFGRGLGDAPMLFDWYVNGDTPSRLFDGFTLDEPSARFFDTIAARVGATVAGRTTYEHSSHWSGGSPHPTAPLFVVSHRPAPDISERQTLISTGVADAIAAAREVAGDKDVALMGGGLVSTALAAGLVDELVLHQVPILLGGGLSFFRDLPDHVQLRLLEVIPAAGVTHLHYEVVR
ncbi:dihydrofolate reductase family protein [Hamadaea sp. NPDC050747]|uniref:dihydrofolate reductase family protein n=1 Tax=Hamadaea sp. NPDC050747 TaxID=3155789 RepID=UPI0033F06BE9